jgi:hypothetical protein
MFFKLRRQHERKAGVKQVVYGSTYWTTFDAGSSAPGKAAVTPGGDPGRISGHLTAGPGFYEVELNEASNSLKIPFVVGHENTAGFSARKRK